MAGAPEPVVDFEAREEAERARAEKAPEDQTIYLTVPRLGVCGHTVRNDDSQRALD